MKVKEIQIDGPSFMEPTYRLNLVKDDGTVIHATGNTVEEAVITGINMIWSEATHQAWLGNASCKELLEELSVRIDIHGPGLDYTTVSGTNK